VPRVEKQLQQRSLTASGRQIKMDSTGIADYRNWKKAEAWQDEAWRFYDIIGEFEYAANWVGNLLSRAKLAVKKDGEPVGDNDPAAQLLNNFFGGPEGQAQMLRMLGVHHTVAGDALIVSWTDSATGDDQFELAAPKNFKTAGGVKTVNGRKIEGAPFVAKVWNPHPSDPERSNAPSRAALPVLSEIEKLTMHVAAQIDSRLTTAGMLLLPNEATFTAAGDKNASDGSIAQGGTDAFAEALQDVMSTAIGDRGSAAANVPIIFTADGEHLKNIKLLKFWSELDAKTLEIRDAAIRRLALSMDMPPEVLLGTGDSNHWAAWSVDESSIKSHTEPTLLHLCAAITDAWLRPALKLDPNIDSENASRYGIFADTSDLRLRPNRSKEAVELWDRGALSDQALIRETGFNPKDDVPDDNETKRRLLRAIASGSATPEMVAQAAEAFGVYLEAEGEEPNESRPRPSLKEHPDQGPPDQDEAEKRAERRARQSALLSASEQVVFRALERAGNKMGNQLKLKVHKDVAPSEAYLFAKVPENQADFVLEGAITHLDRFADDHHVDAETWTKAVYEYCYNLVVKQKRYSKTSLERVVKRLEFTDD